MDAETITLEHSYQQNLSDTVITTKDNSDTNEKTDLTGSSESESGKKKVWFNFSLSKHILLVEDLYS